MFKSKFSFLLVIGFLFLNAAALVTEGIKSLKKELTLTNATMTYIGIFLSWCLLIMIAQRYSGKKWATFVKTRTGINTMKVSCLLAMPGMALIEILSGKAFYSSISGGMTVQSVVSGIVALLILTGIVWVMRKFFTLMYTEAAMSELDSSDDENLLDGKGL